MFPDEASCVAYLERLRWQPILLPKPIRFTDTLGSLKNKINLRMEQSRYPVYLISKNSKFHLSDVGTTYAELDKIFELKEPDVMKNLLAILKQYGCGRQPDTNEFTIECTLDNLPEKMSYLIQAISFMLNMKIFYV